MTDGLMTDGQRVAMSKGIAHVLEFSADAVVLLAKVEALARAMAQGSRLSSGDARRTAGELETAREALTESREALEEMRDTWIEEGLIDVYDVGDNEEQNEDG